MNRDRDTGTGARTTAVDPLSDAVHHGCDINELPDRLAMGLPARLVERTRPDLFVRHRDLFRMEPLELVAEVESISDPFERRLAAGRVLGMLGDLRVSPDHPRTVRVPGGRTSVGLDERDVDAVVRRWSHVGLRREWVLKECPRHVVTVPELDVMCYPVTNAEYRAYLQETGSTELPSSWRFGAYPVHRANEPVWTVSPAAAEAYAAWLSRRTGRRFRLLREAEWEHAAGGGDGREFPWGDCFMPDRANTVDGGPLTTTPVGCYPLGQSPFGVHDMAGNVEEWVADDYAPYVGGHVVADDLAAGGRYRVARGGSFTRFGDLARCRRRHGGYPRDLYAIGFRLAEEAEAEPA